jgi:hypothetical protein
MAKGLRDILKESGQTDEQINSIIATLGPATNLFETTLQAADRQVAEAATKLTEATNKEKQINDFWNNKATPEINEAFTRATTAETARAAAEAERDQLRASARRYGFLADETPEEKTARETREAAARGGAGPVIVPGTNVVPGSPGAAPGLNKADVLDAITTSSYLMTEHQRLFGEPLPDLRAIIEEVGRRPKGTKAVQVWEDKYGVPKRREELATAAKLKERETIAAEERTKIAKEYADKYGNEGTAPMRPSRFPTYAKDEKTGAPDKLAWTRPDRKERLRQKIYGQVAKETGHTVQ